MVSLLLWASDGSFGVIKVCVPVKGGSLCGVGVTPLLGALPQGAWSQEGREL